MGVLGGAIGGALAPTIKDLTERITRIVVSATAWVKANIEYSLVLERIQPLTNELAGYEANLQKGQEKLQKLEEKLRRERLRLDQQRVLAERELLDVDRRFGHVRTASDEAESEESAPAMVAPSSSTFVAPRLLMLRTRMRECARNALSRSEAWFKWRIVPGFASAFRLSM